MSSTKTPNVSPANVSHHAGMLTQRTWLLLRRFDEKNSLFFVPQVHVQEDEPALFTATIKGLENRLAAAGHSMDEAEGNAIDMFQLLVDYSVKTKTPLSFELGTQVPATVVPITLEKAGEFFDAVCAALANVKGAHAVMEEWRSVPTTNLVASQQQLLALSEG